MTIVSTVVTLTDKVLGKFQLVRVEIPAPDLYYRVGVGRNSFRWYFRIDLGKVGYRITRKIDYSKEFFDRIYTPGTTELRMQLDDYRQDLVMESVMDSDVPTKEVVRNNQVTYERTDLYEKLWIRGMELMHPVKLQK